MTYVNDTGLPSTTTIINTVAAHWMPADFYTEEGRDRGTAVHSWCAAYAEGRYAVPVRPEWRGYCDSFRWWADEYLDFVLLAEKRLSDHRYGFCGKPDMVIRMKGRGGVGLIDIKTGAKEELPHRIQVAAYRHLYDLGADVKTSWGGILRLRDGERAIFDAMPDDYRCDFNLFLSALNVFRAFNNN